MSNASLFMSARFLFDPFSYVCVSFKCVCLYSNVSLSFYVCVGFHIRVSFSYVSVFFQMCVSLFTYVWLFSYVCVSFQMSVSPLICVCLFSHMCVSFHVSLFSCVCLSAYMRGSLFIWDRSLFIWDRSFFMCICLSAYAWVPFRMCVSLSMCAYFFAYALVSFDIYVGLFWHICGSLLTYLAVHRCGRKKACLFAHTNVSFHMYWSLLTNEWVFNNMYE